MEELRGTTMEELRGTTMEELRGYYNGGTKGVIQWRN